MTLSIPSEVTFKTTITAAEARESLWGSGYRSRFWRFTVMLAIFALIIVVTGVMPGADRFSLWLGLYWAAGVFLVFAALYLGALFLFGYSVASCNRSHNGSTWRITDEGAEIKEGHTTASFEWTAFRGFIETNTLILVRLARKKADLIIPKRCLTPTETKALLRMLSTKLSRITT